MGAAKNWASADAGPGRKLDDVRIVEWRAPKSFRKARAKWLLSIRQASDVRLSNMVWLLHVVAGFMKHQNDTAWPSIPRLAAELGWSEPTVKRAMAQAVAWGWLIRERRYDKSNRYFMSFSVSVVAELADRYRIRTAPFLDRSATADLVLSDDDVEDGDEIKPDLTVGSNLISPTDQIRSHPEIKPDPLYRRDIPLKDTIDPYRAERLGETEQDETPGAALETGPVSEDARLHRDVQLALGGGDIEVGRGLAEVLGRRQIDRLKDRITADGIVGAADELTRAAERARQLLKSKHSRGAADVVA